MFPADVGSNNDRVFVVTASTSEIKAGPQAEVLAQRTLAAMAARGAAPGQPAAAAGPNTTIGPRHTPPGNATPNSDAA
jgi:hypothetical protein